MSSVDKTIHDMIKNPENDALDIIQYVKGNCRDEVLTPQRRQTFSLRSMTVSEEEVLKGSILTPLTVSEHLAEVLWQCIIKKPDDIQTYEDFLK